MGRTTRTTLAGFLVGALLAGANAALAADSSWKSFASNNVSYRNQASMFANRHALTTLQRLDSGQAPAGRMGVKARAYFTDGSLCAASATRFNTVPTTLMTVEQSTPCGDYLYSLGQTFTWHINNDFKVVNTNRTPNVYTGPE